jgi:rubredoxin
MMFGYYVCSTYTRVIGYTADADVWCPTCAARNYGAADVGPNHEPRVADFALDSEGNEVHSIFSTDDVPADWCCHVCGDPIE